MRLSEADFIPSEEWLGEYMGEQGLRYALNKTPEEVEKEGERRDGIFFCACVLLLI